MLLFKKKFLPAILVGAKTQTLRKTAPYRPGQRSYIPGGGYIQIDSVEKVAFENLTDADAIPDGFLSAKALKAELREIYADKLPAFLYRIRFHLLPEAEQKSLMAERKRNKNTKNEPTDGFPEEFSPPAQDFSASADESPPGDDFSENSDDFEAQNIPENLFFTKKTPALKIHTIPPAAEEPRPEKSPPPPPVPAFSENFLTRPETAAALLNRCRVHRNVCSWTHEPTKTQDFFAIFLKSPRDEHGIPILDGYTLLADIRALVTAEEWEEIRWLAADVCQFWTEWQYAVQLFNA